jgi:hypothetical protein
MGFLNLPGIVGTVGTPDDPIANEQKVLNAGRITYKAFEVFSFLRACLLTMADLCVVA